jgi:hypothetical protein
MGVGSTVRQQETDDQHSRRQRQGYSRRRHMGRDGFVYPLTDRAQTILRLIVVLGIMGMTQTQDEEDIQ